jgi:nicotinate-nucleotide adenylyltransferase
MIAILGGTFDPIHKGHLHIASRIFDLLPVTRVQFMPCAVPVHRNQPLASAEQRCAMVELAIAGDDRFALNRLEIERGAPSYTVDSLRELHRRGSETIALVLGSDAYNGFADWDRPQEILELAHLVVCLRPGSECVTGGFESHRVNSVEALQSRSAGAILIVEVDAPDCASRELRRRIAAGQPPDGCLSESVARYIDTHQLYRESQ